MSRRFCETTGYQRLLWAAAAGVAMGIVPLPASLPTRALMAWCVAAVVYLGLAWWLAHTVDDADSTREHSTAQDQPSVVLFVLVLAIAFASTGAIAMMQQNAKDMEGLERALHLALSVAALVCSWLWIQTVFAFRYAHRFYSHGAIEGKRAKAKKYAGGLSFPEDAEPDYLDFLYYSHVVGMTSQVSDVVVTSREMRFLTLVHSGLSFAFNMLVVALSINMMASALQ